jgi:D-alanine-D-alanine ligase
MKIAVLFGGTSEERDVSIASAAQIIPVLRNLGHEVFAVDTATGRLGFTQERRLLSAAVGALPPSDTEIARVRGGAMALTPAAFDFRDADVVFLALHGGAGEDGRIQAVLDLAGIAYTGSNHIASAAAMDKDLSKRLFRSVDVPTPDWLMAPALSQMVEAALGWPVVVKPNKQGSTVGLTVVREAAQLPDAIDRACSQKENTFPLIRSGVSSGL